MTPPKGKQRSIHMDDETFELLKSLATEKKLNLSSVVRLALMNYSGKPAAPPREPPVPVSPARLDETGRKIAATKAAASILPDPKQETFKVKDGNVAGLRRAPPAQEREDEFDV